MRIGELMNLKDSDIQALSGIPKGVYRNRGDYMNLFTYLTETEAHELCNQLLEIPIGHKSRVSVVNYYSKINLCRKQHELEEVRRNRQH